MRYVIRDGNKNDVSAVGYVRSVAWHEAYADLVSKEALDRRTPEYCVQRLAYLRDDSNSFNNKADFVVAERDGSVVGFCMFGECQDTDMEGHGEICALYILTSEYGSGIGQKLVETAHAKMGDLGLDHPFVLWVLDGNGRAIRFYEKMGYAADGERAPFPELGEGCYKMRMIEIVR